MANAAVDTIVMGAGPAGLAAAYELTRHGRPVLVVERAGVVGGLARTIERDGFRFDIGGHRWFTKNEELNNLFRTLLAGEIVNVRRVSRIYFAGRYVDYPLRLRNVLGAVGLAFGARAVVDFARAQVWPPGSDGERSMADAYTAQFGRALYERFFRDYSEKVWGEDCRQLSGDWVVQRSRGMSLFTAVRDALWSSGGQVESLVERFMYPRLGYGRLSERLAEETRRAGGTVALETGVTAVHHRAGRVEAIDVRRSDGSEETVEGAHFLSTIPLSVLVRLLRPAPPEAVQRAASALRFRDLITVHLMLRRERVTRDTWLYVHDPRIPFGRLHEPKNWSAALVPDAAHTSLVAEYFCTIGDAIWQQDDAALVALTVDHLSRTLGFIDPREVVGGFAVRSPHAYPVYRLGYREPLEQLKAYAASLAGLQLVGRGGAFRYNNADHAIEAGLLAARNVLGESYDLDRVNGAAEYLEVRHRARQASPPRPPAASGERA